MQSTDARIALGYTCSPHAPGIYIAIFAENTECEIARVMKFAKDREKLGWTFHDAHSALIYNQTKNPYLDAPDKVIDLPESRRLFATKEGVQ
jgi:hypothetical protein